MRSGGRELRSRRRSGGGRVGDRMGRPVQNVVHALRRRQTGRHALVADAVQTVPNCGGHVCAARTTSACTQTSCCTVQLQ